MEEKERYNENDCVETGLSCSIKGKVVILNRETLPPCSQKQLYYCLCGNGAGVSPTGRAVFLVSLRTGEFSLKNRNEVVGVLKPELLPDQAKLQLSQIRNTAATAFCRMAGTRPACGCAANRRRWIMWRCRGPTSTAS